LISKTRLIFCSQFNPSTINFNLLDLFSRIKKIDHIELLPVSERNLKEALKFITDINSYEIGDNEINYLMTHSKRSIANLLNIIYELDQLSLQLKRKITIPLIKELIQR
jgi:DnaA family protein